MTDSSSYVIIQVAEDGATKFVKTRENVILETSPNLLDKLLKLADISIGEFRTIILIKLIKPDGCHTWLIKHPPEARCKGCTNCRCRTIHGLEDESLWVQPKNSYASDNPIYLTIQIEEDGEVELVKVRNVTLEPSASLWDKPLSLGDVSIGGFLVITLIKLAKPDNFYTWLIRHPVEMGDASPELVGCTYTYTGFYEPLWIKPEDDIS